MNIKTIGRLFHTSSNFLLIREFPANKVHGFAGKKTACHTGPYRAIWGHNGPHGAIRGHMGHLGPYRAINIKGNMGPYQTIQGFTLLNGTIQAILGISDLMGPYRNMGPYLAI